eukprot:Nitzschia sp. Nitz4//scaffold235_size30605//652//1413//NITZ4_007969-RA/size30605-augustus-gene-0.15-mRNA-1//-1//CDS//3329543435//5565//frame0
MSALSYTKMLAASLCGGSSRRLIAGWWYSILALTCVLSLMACGVVGTRSFSEGFVSVWSALLLLALSIGGTMIMRKFHNSMAVGFFMGGVVALSQMFFFLSMIYLGYRKDNVMDGLPAGRETRMAIVCFLQFGLLGSFATILAAHRSEIIEKDEMTEAGTYDTPYTAEGTYDTPYTAAS